MYVCVKCTYQSETALKSKETRSLSLSTTWGGKRHKMLIEDLAAECLRHPESSLAYYAPNGSMSRASLAEIGRAALALFKRLSAAGLQAGHVVGIRAENHPDWLVWDLATAKLNAVLRPYPSHHAFARSSGLPNTGWRCWCPISRRTRGRRMSLRSAPTGSKGRWCAGKRRQRAGGHPQHRLLGDAGREKVLMISRRGAELALNLFIDVFHPNSADRHVVFLPFANYQQRPADLSRSTAA